MGSGFQIKNKKGTMRRSENRMLQTERDNRRGQERNRNLHGGNEGSKGNGIKNRKGNTRERDDET